MATAEKLSGSIPVAGVSQAPLPGALSATPVFRTPFACVTMNMTDRLRFIKFPKADFEAIRAACEAAWDRGIQEVRPYDQAMEIKLAGNPWRLYYTGDDKVRRLMRSLLEHLLNRGWVLQASVDCCMKTYDKDSLIFRHQSPPPPQHEWLAVSFEGNDRLTFLETPNSDVINALVQTYGDSVEWHGITGGHFEIKFSGMPWLPSGTDTVSTRILLLNLLQALEGFGYSLYASIAMEVTTDGKKADVLYFTRQADWAPGLPVWHR